MARTARGARGASTEGRAGSLQRHHRDPQLHHVRRPDWGRSRRWRGVGPTRRRAPGRLVGVSQRLPELLQMREPDGRHPCPQRLVRPGKSLQSGGRTGMDAAPGAEAVGAPGALGAPAARLGMAGGAPFGEGASPTRSNWSPLSAGGQTEFLLALGRGQAGGGAAPGPHWTVWGQHDQQAFGGERSPAARYDGHLRTAYVGFDGRLSERWLAGVAVSRSRGDGDWTFGSSAGRLTTTLTSVRICGGRTAVRRSGPRPAAATGRRRTSGCGRGCRRRAPSGCGWAWWRCAGGWRRSAAAWSCSSAATRHGRG